MALLQTNPNPSGTPFVAVLGSEFGKHPRNTEAVSGEDITLDCVPPRGEPAPRVRWMKDNNPLKPDSERVTVLQSGDLRIRDVNRQDSGSYVCIAFNIGGERDSNVARLTVRGLSVCLSVCLLPVSILLRPLTRAVNSTPDCGASFWADARLLTSFAQSWERAFDQPAQLITYHIILVVVVASSGIEAKGYCFSIRTLNFCPYLALFLEAFLHPNVPERPLFWWIALKGLKVQKIDALNSGNTHPLCCF